MEQIDYQDPITVASDKKTYFEIIKKNLITKDLL